MSRGLAAGVLSEIAADSVQPILFLYGSFSTGDIRMWSGLGNVDWDGETWVGAGNLVQISNIEEPGEIKAQGIIVTFNGIPADLISIVLQSVYQGALGKVWLGFLSNGSIVADPWLVFEGRLDVPVIDEDAETCSITITYESKLIDLLRSRSRRYTDQDQQNEYAGDVGMQYVTSLQEKEIPWGRKTDNLESVPPQTETYVSDGA